MVKRGFFSHKNPDGESAGDRAKRLGISGRIAENLAKSQSLTSAHVGLANSPGHFRNSVNRDFERVGFGIARDRRGSLYLTVVLSPRDLNKQPLSTLQRN